MKQMEIRKEKIMAKKLYPFSATWSGLTKKGKEREKGLANGMKFGTKQTLTTITKIP